MRWSLLFLLVLTCSLVSAASHGVYPSFSAAEQGFVVNNQSLSVLDDAVYKTAWYSIAGADWQSFSLSGTPYGTSTDWLSGVSTASLPDFGVGEHYVIIYSCSNPDNWDCHGNNDYPDGFWQLQVINVTADGGPVNYLRTFYVSNSLGNDSNNGTDEQHPWQTLEYAESHATTPGDLIALKRGDTFVPSRYFVINQHGNKTNPILWDGGLWGVGDDAVIQYGDRLDMVMLADAEYLTFQNLILDGMYMNTNGFCLGDFQETTGGANNIIIQNCEIKNMGDAPDISGAGIFLTPNGTDCRNITIQNNYIHSIGTHAIAVYKASANIGPGTNSHILIRNNTIEDWHKYSSVSGCGVIVRNDNEYVTIENNTFEMNNGGLGVSVEQVNQNGNRYSTNFVCRYNAFNMVDGPAVAFDQGDAVTAKVYGNTIIVSDTGTTEGVGGLSISGGDDWTGASIGWYDNTIINRGHARGIDISDYAQQFLTIRNNLIFSDDGGACFQASSVTNVNHDHNLYYKEGTTYSSDLVNILSPTAHYTSSTQVQGWEPTSITDNPLFVDTANGDYRLQEGSPAIDAGIDIGFEFSGLAPDIGAYEYQSGPKTYYVSNSLGNNANSGTDEQHPWKTIAKVNSQSFEPGDSILFKRGDTWREPALEVSDSGNSAHWITYGAYGTGDKPQILGSVNATGWTNQGGNIWSSTTASIDPLSLGNGWGGAQTFFVGLDNSVTWGNNKTFDTLANEYDWAYVGSTLYVYSPTNPGLRYSSVEAPQRETAVELHSHAYLSFTNLTIRYLSSNGLHEDYGIIGVNGLNVTHCDIGYIGVKGSMKAYGLAVTNSNAYYAYNELHDCGRRSISINLYSTTPVGTMENILIEHNHFYGGFHTTGVDAGDNGAHTIRNITIRNNFFEGDPDVQLDGVNPNSNHIFIAQQANGHIENISIYNNVFTYAHGKAISFERVDTAYIYYNTFYGWNPTLNNYESLINLGGANDSDIHILNNILYDDADTSFSGNFLTGIYVSHPLDSSFSLDHNLYYATDPATHLLIFYGGGVDNEYTTSQWSTYLSAYAPNDAHSSTPQDPLFASTTNDNFTLSYNSPARAAGTPISWVTTDYLGNPRDSTNPSIGAYESDYAQVPCEVYTADYYLAPWGNDSNNGSFEYPFYSLNKAWTVIQPGDLVYLRGGTYNYTVQQYLRNKNGATGNMIKIWAYPGETPVISRGATFTYSNSPYWCGIFFTGDYVHFKGLEITGFYQEDEHVWSGLRVENGNHNIFELLNIHHNGHGFALIFDSTDNLILNSDFHHNSDPVSPIPYGNADGLEIAYVSSGNTNTVRGCRFWWNSDDGFDLWANDGNVIIDNCWSWNNGYIPDTFTLVGNGNGFKLGSQSANYSDKILRTITHSLAYHNPHWGFVDNGATCNMKIYNNIAYKNGEANSWAGGFHFNMAAGEGVPYYIKNNLGYADLASEISANTFTNINNNSWNLPVTLTDDDFVSVDPTGLDGPRQADGSLPELDFLKLAPGSNLIDAGTDVGLPYQGSAPDMGAFESSYTACIPDTSCAASTCVGQTCDDGCGNAISGTKDCSSPTGAIIADHTAVAAFDSLSSTCFDDIRSNYNFFYGHTSHGSQIISGLDMLQTENSVLYLKPSFNDPWDDLGHDGDVSWVPTTRAALDTGNYNVAVWSWCLGASDNTFSGLDTYLNAINQLESDYPNVVFIYMTGHLDGTGEAALRDGVNPNLRMANQYIRDYVIAHDKILFDFEDIESWDPDGNYYVDDTDACNWCSTWCSTHSCPADSYCAHSHCFNCYRKGKAFWWMMAKVAERDGVSQSCT